MPKKKGFKRNSKTDFTINDYANASKPVGREKKTTPTETLPPELTWDQIHDDDCDVIEEINADGTKNFVYKKKKKHSKPEEDVQDPGVVYPEIVWYLISQYIKPEDVGRFAGINRATFAITYRESFWRTLYKRYCQNNPKLPERLRLENSYKLYGLRQRVVRALYHTYDVFIKKILRQAAHDSSPRLLIKRKCVNMWYCKECSSHWFMFFKFKKPSFSPKIKTNFIDELGRIDANPEENNQVLQVTCHGFYEVPALMGMTLSSVSFTLSQGFRHHRLRLGFNTGHHNVSRNILPECTVVLDAVVNILILDWWHPKYPHFETTLRLNVGDEEQDPVLKKDFFNDDCN